MTRLSSNNKDWCLDLKLKFHHNHKLWIAFLVDKSNISLIKA